MAIRLSDHEAAPRHDGSYADVLAAVQARLARLQIAQIVHRRRAVVVLEGWGGSGKGGVIRRLVAGWDARACRVWPIGAATADEAARHFLWRFWARMPAAGEIAVFDRSWYRRVLAERVDGLLTRAEWRRAYDEINEFEAQQTDGGTTLIKLFLHVSADEQQRRFGRRLAHPWKRWKLTDDDLREGTLRADHVVAVEEMLERTDTRWAPWHVVDAGNKKAARLAALGHVADRLEKAMPSAPPEIEPAILAAARASGLVPA